MDMGSITTLITSVGFPIVACGAMGLYVKHITDAHSQERKEQAELHREEMENVTSALNNNTIALTKLCERMEKE